MKNEVLARAITGIDDDLIVSAHRRALFKPRIIRRFSAVAAACLIFVCGTMFLSHNNRELEILINGTAVSSQPVSVTTQNARQVDPAANVITVPLEIVSDGELTITTVDGTIEVYSLQTYEPICTGQSCKTNGPAAVQWILDDPNRNQTCKIHVNHQELILRYEKTTNNWMITRSED